MAEPFRVLTITCAGRREVRPAMTCSATPSYPPILVSSSRAGPPAALWERASAWWLSPSVSVRMYVS